MNILIVHNYYNIPGGEDAVVKNEIELLTKKGHKVFTYFKYNKDLITSGIKNKFKIFKNTIFNKDIESEIKKIIRLNAIDVVHCHNIFPQVSPSIYKYAKECGCKVFQTIHNFRFLCANALLLKNEKICKKCISGTILNGVFHKCYHNSFLESLTWYLMIKKFYNDKLYNFVDKFICLTEFNKDILSTKLPCEKMVIKPNFSTFIINKKYAMSLLEKKYFLFVGRLDKSKGIDKLINYFEKQNKYKLVVCGDGPLLETFKNQDYHNVLIKGHCSKEEIINSYRSAYSLIVPSIWYEGFPMTILESLSQGVPVIVNNIGNLPYIIKDGFNGLVCDFSNIEKINDTLNKMTFNNTLYQQLVVNSIKSVETLYSPDINYKQLMSIYNYDR